VIEMHFHFFVMIGVITLDQDWLPFGLARGYVVVHHGLLGTLRPTDVDNHPARLARAVEVGAHPRRVRAAASVASLVTWWLSETQAIEISRLVSRLEGLARTIHSPASSTGGYGTRSCPDHGPHRVGGHDSLEQEHDDRKAQQDADERGQSGQGEPRHNVAIPFAGRRG
jgi:hypothetical protein